MRWFICELTPTDSTSVPGLRSTRITAITMSSDKTIVFFDLETTGLDTDVCDIIQVSAICGERVFNAYALPHRALTESAKNVTGFTVRGGSLFRHGNLVQTSPIYDVLTSFIAFLGSFRGPVVLAAHNARRFDAPVLTRVLQQHRLRQTFQLVVSGFLDTFLLSKNVFHGLASYGQEYLVHHFLRQTYDTHNAVEDARMLQKLFNLWNPTSRDISRFTYRSSQAF